LLVDPGPQEAVEGEPWRLRLAVGERRDLGVRVRVSGLPPGARWSEEEGQVDFTPDFTQGGPSHLLRFTAWTEDERETVRVVLGVADTIQPPSPILVETESWEGWELHRVQQVTDTFLDAPGFDGRGFDSVVMVPVGEDVPVKLSVRVRLHGLGGDPSENPNPDEILVSPHDPENTCWWGYAEGLPSGEATGANLPYTQRRVLHLLAWVLRTWPQADPERVVIEGRSMGGAGAATLGLLRGRHFAAVRATRGQTVPVNTGVTRAEDLVTIWGSPEQGLPDDSGRSAWETLDLTRALQEDPEARDQWLALQHGKDDSSVHFGAVVRPSPLTGQSFYESLQVERVGHYAVWDEGGHETPDPVLGEAWWDLDWEPESQLHRDRSFPAFTRSSHDRDPGDGSGNGLRPWDAQAGYSGDPTIAGDSGWSGELAGAWNRSLRWQPASVVDTWERWEVALYVEDGDGEPPPDEGYPTTGDRPDGPLPIVVDVTLRRVQAFRLLPGEQVTWSMGAQSGAVDADERGVVTIEGVEIGAEPEVLSVWR